MNRCAPWRSVVVVSVAAAWGVGCSSDIFDVNVQLSTEAFSMDFGTASGTIPTVTCDPADPTVCGAGTEIAFANETGQATIMPGCDAGRSSCFVRANATVSYGVDVLQDESFTSKVGRRSVSLVRMLNVGIVVPVNTLTFDIPQADVYVGPPGTAQPSDPGVFLVDSVLAIPAGASIKASDGRHLQIADGSPGRALIETSIENKTPFVFVLSMTPILESGAVVPAGTLEVDLLPVLGLGLR